MSCTSGSSETKNLSSAFRSVKKELKNRAKRSKKNKKPKSPPKGSVPRESENIETEETKIMISALLENALRIFHERYTQMCEETGWRFPEKEKIATLQSEKEALYQRLNKLDADNSAKDKSLKDLEQKKVEIVQNHEQELAEKLVEIDSLKTKIKNGRDELIAKQNAIEEMTAKILSLEEDMQKERQNLSATGEIIETKEANISSLQEHVQQLKGGIEVKEKLITTKTFEITNLKQDIQELKESINAKDEQINEQTSEITNLKQDIQELKESINAKDEQINEQTSEITNLKQDIQELKENVNAKDEQINAQTAEIIKLRNVLENTLRKAEASYSELKRRASEESARLRNTIDHLQSTVVAERKAKEDALTRLSAAAASKLRDKNPGITDLSDPNRPLKLSEKISELYDNEWTNAMEKLEDEGFDEDEAVVVLLRIFTTLFTKFKEAGEKHLEGIPTMIVVPDLDDNDGNDSNAKDMKKIPGLPTEIMKPIKDFRKAHAERAIERLKKKTISILENDGQTEKILGACSEYITSCTEICWLMCVQDPPVHMRWDFKPNDDFDTNIMRSYTKSGKYVSYVVWPVLYLHEGGPLLAKGVVQGRKMKVEAPKPAKNVDGEGKLSDENHEQSSPDVKSSKGKDTTDSEPQNSSEDRGHTDDAEKTKKDDSSGDPCFDKSKIGNGYGIQEGGNSDQPPNNTPGDTANSNDDGSNGREERSESFETNKSDENYQDAMEHISDVTGNQDDENNQGFHDDTDNKEDNESETNLTSSTEKNEDAAF